MNFESDESSSNEEEQVVCQSVEALSSSDDEKDTEQLVDSDDGKGFEDLRETVNQITNCIKTKDFSSMLSGFKSLETYSKRISKEHQNGIHRRFYIPFLAKLQDCTRKVWDNRKILAKRIRQDLHTVRKKLEKISKTLAFDLAEYRENPDHDLATDEDREEKKKNSSASLPKKSSTTDASSLFPTDLPLLKLMLPEVNIFWDGTFKTGSARVNKKHDYKTPKYVDKGFDLLASYDCNGENWGSRKMTGKTNRSELDAVRKKLRRISGTSVDEVTKYRETLDIYEPKGKKKKNKSKTENMKDTVLVQIYSDKPPPRPKEKPKPAKPPPRPKEKPKPQKKSKSQKRTKGQQNSHSTVVDSPPPEIREPMVLPYHPDVDTFGERILIDSSARLTYEEAYQNPKYIDVALGLENSSNTVIPIEFTQFVLRKMAVGATLCPTFIEALDPRAKEYLSKLIEPEDSEVRQVHPGNAGQRPNLFRSQFTKLFGQKVITNLQNVDLEPEKFNKLARVFPFRICKKVPKYEIDISNEFDDGFYDRMQHFLDEHFDKHVPVRETTELFLNNIRHFFKTKFSSEHQCTQYLKKFPRLNDEGIVHFQQLYKQYSNVRKYFKKCKRRTQNFCYENEDFRKLPEKNIDELAFLLQPTEFRPKPKIYESIFKKYLFFFVHTFESFKMENRRTPVFLIDDMVYQCLKSLRRFRTHRKDIKLVDDIAMISLLGLLGHNGNLYNWDGCLKADSDCYSINLKTLQNIKMYITTFVSKQNKNVQIDFEYKTDLFCKLPFIVNNTICFNVCYATKKNNCERGIMYFLRRLICSVLSPEAIPIQSIVCYSAFLGQENRYVVPQNIVESVKNFVRLSSKTTRPISEISPSSTYNEYLILLRDHLE